MLGISSSNSAASTASSGVGGDFNVTSGGGKLTWLPWVIVAGVVVFGLILFRKR